MRIFFVTCEYIDSKTQKVIDGGLANYLHKITHILKDLGHDVSVVVTSNENKKIIHDGINIHYLKSKKFKLKKIIHKIFFDKEFKKTLHQRTIKDFLEKENAKQKIDIIQYASVLSLGLYPLKSVPSCVRISSYAKNHQEGYGIRNETEIFNETEMFKKHKFIFGPSKHMAKIIRDDLGLENEIEIIETLFAKKTIEVDLTDLNKIKEITKDKSYLLFFGTLGLLKGCKEIADCIYNVLNTYPDLFFVFVGKQSPIDEILPIDLIKKSAKEHQNRIIYFDSMQHDSLYPIIENSKACIMPSRTENFSNTCIEAMAFKKIVIGTDPFFNQIIEDGKNGFLCESKNPQSLNLAIDKIMALSDKELLEMGESAYYTTLRLDPNKIANQVLLYYDYVIKNWNKR